MNDNREQSGNEQELESFLQKQQADFNERSYWLQHSLGAETHWLFIQAYDALKHELYLPACTGFLTGIEGSLRNTMAQVKIPAPIDNVDDISLLSNSLLRQARANGMSIDALAFPGEQDFETNLPTRQNVELVRVRHTLCHGNILEYVSAQEDLPALFTPECCRDLANKLHVISRNWVANLGAFRKQAMGLQ
ncbi:hypothetical protein PSH89_13655 [Pseudomonas sp. FP1911]|jgi:hypothetical protein|uniref:Uncharacterized protein n=2 Tax=Pseudomonas fluorescens group TaxID=136843 RepID=A0A3G7U7S6_9PSED|nr:MULTISPECIES: hypothetical protein [Pseudomonas]AZE55350.1 hypothetical protein C4K03_3195 [Pseudomonas synxantha]MDF2793190.1 hypothetical protein [Pseudomonas orientalis]MDH0796359.1 hypothetical protein [Pseudomonas carnis]UOB26522.1 hypothetical protein MRY17_12755 [Pseudomonas orientalis]WLG77009.1 hypothetical protein PSH89_13655 [Pseudomonas sp. FP1911]